MISRADWICLSRPFLEWVQLSNPMHVLHPGDRNIRIFGEVIEPWPCAPIIMKVDVEATRKIPKEWTRTRTRSKHLIIRISHLNSMIFPSEPRVAGDLCTPSEPHLPPFEAFWCSVLALPRMG